MQIRVSLLPALEGVQADVDVAIVIDVLRATSVITTALTEGAARVHTRATVEQALELRNAISHTTKNSEKPLAAPLLCGERGCEKIDGFDLGNSPSEYTHQVVAGRELIVTTTNGTAAIAASTSARCIRLASFLNLTAIVRGLPGTDVVHLVCAGTDGCITTEDVLLAGAIIESALNEFDASLHGDQAFLAQRAWLSARTDDLPALLRSSRGGRNLVSKGFDDDIQRCAATDATDVVPERAEGDRSDDFTFVPG